jgi:hypothetical protein
MKKFLINLVIATFLLSMPVFSEGREALEGEETQLPVTLTQTSSHASLQTISIGVGRRRNRRWRRRSAWRRRARWQNRRNRGRHLGWRNRGRRVRRNTHMH